MMCLNFIFVFLTFISCFLNFSSEYQTCSKYDPKCESQQAHTANKYAQFQHINIVLFGATGDLSKKYLWNSLLEMYEFYSKEHSEYKFSIYAIGRVERPEGRKFLSEFFLNLPKCKSDECHKIKKGFSECVQYFKIVTVRDFLAFEAMINENTQSLYGLTKTQKSQEVGRFFYLAIPPSAYLQTIERIYLHLLPKYGHPWVRLALEKPFGADFKSAKEMAEKISTFFNESQIYRVDHYLGKNVIQEILPFRTINHDSYGHLWNKEHIKRVEIVMEEKVSASRRTGTYNEMGVVRDVMQNHLTEMFTLVAMRTPDRGSSSIKDLQDKKLELLLKTTLAKKNKVITAQYSTYNAEWLAENDKLNEVTDTATFAAALFYVEDDQWQGVPFVLVAGKKLESKNSYVRVVFKKSDVNGGDEHENRQLVFYIDGKLGQFIAASKDLPSIAFKRDWTQVHTLASKGDICGTPQEHMNIYVPRKRSQAYTEVLKGVIDGSRHNFVPIELLTQSWLLWDQVVEESLKVKPRKYLGLGKDKTRLAFKHSVDNGIEFEHTETSIPNVF